MNRPIRAGDYVEHFDPQLDHHRAWLQAVLEQLVGHDPQALEEGGTLRRLWVQHQQETLAAAQAAATGSRHPNRYPNPLVGVPYVQQRDSAKRSQRDRSCFSSGCAMLLESLRTGTLPGSNGDDAYLAVVQRYGDTTDASAQPQALARGITVRCCYIHRGPVDRPTGSGHWLLVYGHSPSHLVVHDPWGEPDLLIEGSPRPEAGCSKELCALAQTAAPTEGRTSAEQGQGTGYGG